MADRPIIFSAPMVRALLDGRKTQTRRLVTSPLSKCLPGDRLWVRETIEVQGNYPDGSRLIYDASRRRAGSEAIAIVSVPEERRLPARPGKLIPSIHMPRWASRITLVVTETRRQQLQAISEADAIAEGAEPCANGYWFDGSHVLAGSTARGAFYCLWTRLNGVQSWDANPDIIALTSEVQIANIDTLEASHG